MTSPAPVTRHLYLVRQWSQLVCDCSSNPFGTWTVVSHRHSLSHIEMMNTRVLVVTMLLICLLLPDSLCYLWVKKIQSSADISKKKQGRRSDASSGMRCRPVSKQEAHQLLMEGQFRVICSLHSCLECANESLSSSIGRLVIGSAADMLHSIRLEEGLELL